MTKYLIIHPVGKELTLESATPIAKAIKSNHTTDAYWVRSWYAREEGKLYCEWDAKDIESIRKIITRVDPEFPVEGIYELDSKFNIHSEQFR